MSVLITGGCGFIGHHLVYHILTTTDYNINILDKLSYASTGWRDLEQNGVLKNRRVQLLTWDLTKSLSVGLTQFLISTDYIVHLAAETHVDNSISDPRKCIDTNVQSTVEMLQLARQIPNLRQFLYFSTDEVFGSADYKQSFHEKDRHNPTNPYSASKSASEAICRAYMSTYNIPVVIVRSMNVFGARQHPEKFIPKCIHHLLSRLPILIHCSKDGLTPGSRFYIHVSKVCEAIAHILVHGSVAVDYHIRGQVEVDNEQLLLYIAEYLGISDPLYIRTHTDSQRPGHDMRYDISGPNLTLLGYDISSADFWTLLRTTIDDIVRELPSN